MDLWICGSMGPWISQTKTNFRNASSPSGLSLNLWNGDVRRKKKKSHDCNWGDECHKTIEVFKMMLEINHHQHHHQYYHHHHPATKEQGKRSLRLRLITFFSRVGVGCWMSDVRPFVRSLFYFLFYYPKLEVGTGKILSVRNFVVDPNTVQIFMFIPKFYMKQLNFNK